MRPAGTARVADLKRHRAAEAGAGPPRRVDEPAGKRGWAGLAAGAPFASWPCGYPTGSVRFTVTTKHNADLGARAGWDVRTCPAGAGPWQDPVGADGADGRG
jgi:hypothetical protein